VHFAGHGHPDGSLEIASHTGRSQRIGADALAQLFQSYAGQVRLVVLNACYSDALADALVEHIDAVVGMTRAISDEAAIAFAPALYQQLAGGKSVQTACDVARSVVLGQLPEAGEPARDVGVPERESGSTPDDAGVRMRVRIGVDASTMVFAVRGGAEATPATGWAWYAAAMRRPGVRWVAAAVVVLALLGARFVGQRALAADRLVVRVHEPGAVGGMAHVAGRITLHGPDTAVRTRPLADGEAVFEDLPPGVAGRAVEVSVEGAAGFRPTSELRIIPESGILGVVLARAEVTSIVAGTVLDVQGQPLAGAAIDIEHGLVTGTTDPRGDFRIVVPLAPGALVSVVVAVNGHVGFRDNLTVPGTHTLRWAP
jgi:CHAT domain